MNIIICVKAMIQTSNNGEKEICINPYDLSTLEYFVGIKNKYDCNIICLCMGPKNMESALRYCLALGVDEAVFISDNKFAGSDTYATSYILSKGIEKIKEYDVIVCGRQTIDGETGQVPYGIAHRLGLSCIANVLEILDLNETGIKVKSRDDSYLNTVHAKLPIMLIFNNCLIDPPDISLLKLKMAKKKEIRVLNLDNMNLDCNLCGLKGSLTKVLDIEKKIKTKDKKILNGTTEDIAQNIVDEILNVIK